MSQYILINLKEVEDSVGARSPEVEGRFARKHLTRPEEGDGVPVADWWTDAS